MIVAHEDEIPHCPLRPLFRLWLRKGTAGRPPARQDIQLTDLRSAAAHALFCEIDRPYRGTSSIRFVNTGTTVVDAIGVDITGLTVDEVVVLLGSTPEFEFCFGEYGRCAEEGVCSYNEGFFPDQEKDWLRYRRLIMPLGDGERPTGLFVMCDFENEAVRLKVPRALAIGEERIHAP